MEGRDKVPFARLSYTGRTLAIFWRHAKKYWPQVTIVVTGVLALTAVQTYTPILYSRLINLLATSSRATVVAPAVHLIVIIFVLNFIRVAVWRASNFANSYFQSKVMSDLTNTCYYYIQKHSSSFFNSRFVGSLVTKVKRYERSFEQLSDQFTFRLGRSAIDIAMILTVMLWQYRMFGLAMLAWCALFIVFSYFYALFRLPYDMRRAAADTHTTAQLADSITNNVNIKLFTSYGLENERFERVTNDQFVVRRKSWDLGVWGDVVQSFS